MNSVANAVEDVAFADRRDHSSTFPEGENGWMDLRERKCCALRLQLLLNLLEISAFGYNPGDSFPQQFYPWVGFRLGVIGEVK